MQAQTTKALLEGEAFSVSPLRVRIKCQPTGYLLISTVGAKTSVSVCKVQDLVVMPAVGGAFTGVMYGLYSFGKGEPVLHPADFTDINTVQEVQGDQQ